MPASDRNFTHQTRLKVALLLRRGSAGDEQSRLKRKGKAKVKVFVGYRPAGEGPQIKARKLTLIRK